MSGGLVLRYNTEKSSDGLPPGEGSFSRLQFLDGECTQAARA